MWNETALRHIVANAGTIRGREGANEDAVAVVEARAAAGDEVRAPPQPRSPSKGEPVIAAGAVALYLDACLTPGSSL